MSNKKMLEEAAKKFINKVETGRARSKETYKELKEALNTDEEVREVIENLKPVKDLMINNYSKELILLLSRIETISKFKHDIDRARRMLQLIEATGFKLTKI